MQPSVPTPSLFPYVPSGPRPLDFWHWAIHNADAGIDACAEAGELGRAFLAYIGVEPPTRSVTTVPGKWLRPGRIFVDVWAQIDDRVELLLHGPGHVRPSEKLQAYAASRPSSIQLVRIELESSFVPHVDPDEHFPGQLIESKLLDLFEDADYSHPAIRDYEQRIRQDLAARRHAATDATSSDRGARWIAWLPSERSRDSGRTWSGRSGKSTKTPPDACFPGRCSGRFRGSSATSSTCRTTGGNSLTASKTGETGRGLA